LNAKVNQTSELHVVQLDESFLKCYPAGHTPSRLAYKQAANRLNFAANGLYQISDSVSQNANCPSQSQTRPENFQAQLPFRNYS
jgi:hypothetical protein